LLTTLSDNSKMWVYFNVPEAEYLSYAAEEKKQGKPKVKLIMANNEHFDHTGIVETIEADFNNETGNIAFRATFPNPDKLLRHGETGTIQMPILLKNAVLIPQEATFEILDRRYVFVIDKNGVVGLREVTIEQEMPHIYVISKGLSTDDMVLVDGIRKVKNGDKIKTEFEPFEQVLTKLQQLHAE